MSGQDLTIRVIFYSEKWIFTVEFMSFIYFLNQFCMVQIDFSLICMIELDFVDFFANVRPGSYYQSNIV